LAQVRSLCTCVALVVLVLSRTTHDEAPDPKPSLHSGGGR